MQHQLGQYFTTNEELKEKVYSFILNKPNNILEPLIKYNNPLYARKHITYINMN